MQETSYKKRTIRNLWLLYVVLSIAVFASLSTPAQAQNKRKTSTITIRVVDNATKEPLPGAITKIEELGVFGMANINGVVTLPNIPFGKWKIVTSILGFKEKGTVVAVSKDLHMTTRLDEESLTLDNVVVTAKRNTAGSRTTESIGRQAMDHIQATSLGDVMQLLPGGLLPDNKDMTSAERINIRSVGYDKNNAYGVSVIMDGMPINDEAAIGSLNGLSAGEGVDMRTIATDNIENIEVVTGVASAEYGEMTSGAVIVHTKAGTTPLRARMKITPSALQTSVSKGFRLPSNSGIMNASFDYANSSGDPRLRTEAFDRISTNLGWSKKIGIWSPNVRFSYSGVIDQSKIDPDEADKGTVSKNGNYSFRLSHDGRFAINRWFSRTIKYTIGTNYSIRDSYQKKIVSTGGTGRVLFNSREEGTILGDILPSSYWAEGGSKGKSFNLYGKLDNSLYVKTGILRQRIIMGVEYRYSKNYGIGKYNENDALPITISDARPRRYVDIPGLTTLSAYLEDNLHFDWDWMPTDLRAGLRAQVSQPGKDESVSAISPRVNLTMKPTKWLNLRIGYGMNAKAPGLSYLYPDYKYFDKIVATYNDGTNQYTYYQTYIKKPDNTKLKNSITQRVQGGLDFTLWKGHSISLTGYIDRNTNGFSSTADYGLYTYNNYSLDNGSIQPQESGAPIIDWSNPNQVFVSKLSAGQAVNNAASENKGIEFSMDLGRIDAIYTSFFIRGAWARSTTWTKGDSYSNPREYVGDSDLSPIKFVRDRSNQKQIGERLSNQFEAVCHIPKLAMVASLTGQMIWYTYSKSTSPLSIPYRYIDSNLISHDITADMLSDLNYTIDGYNLQNQIIDTSDSRGVWSTPLWVMNARLTKNVSKYLKCSFYASNVNYYQPWTSSNITTTKSEKNTNNFSFGVEVSVKI